MGDDDHNIPGEILREILIRLPLKSLLQFRNVCKDWQSMIDDPVLAKLHHDRQQGGRHMVGFHDKDVLFHTVSMSSLACATTDCTRTIQARNIDNYLKLFPIDVASPCRCHGFFLSQWKDILCDDKDQLISVKHHCSLWNPFTAQLLELPSVPVDTDDYFVFTGLGYVSATYEYKVVLIFSRCDGAECTTYIYSLKSGVWRRLQGLPHRCYSSTDAVFVNGALHWGRVYGQREERMDCILAFDLSTETFSELPMPPCKGHWHTMDALGGYLMVMSRTSTPDMMTDRSMCDFWILEDYDDNKYWRKLITLDCRKVSPPAAVDYIKSKEQVVIRTRYHKFAWYDIRNDDDVKLVKTVTLNCYQEEEEDEVFPRICVWWTNVRDYGTTDDDDSKQSTVNQQYELNKLDIQTVFSPTS